MVFCSDTHRDNILFLYNVTPYMHTNLQSEKSVYKHHPVLLQKSESSAQLVV